jgi:hypothetical protein
LCHSTTLGVHVLGSKNWGRKGLISYEIETSTMKKHCEVEHFDILKMYVDEIVQQHFVETNVFMKQSSKSDNFRIHFFIFQ